RVAAFAYLRGDLRTELEARRVEVKVEDHVASEDLVRRRLVRNALSVEHGRGAGEDPVRQPVLEAHAGDRPVEAVPVDDVRPAALDRLDECRIVRWVVLEVGVLDEDDVAARVLQTDADGSALAHVDHRLVDADEVAALLPLVLELVESAVGGAVVDD